jgi:hypothetical protein
MVIRIRFWIQLSTLMRIRILILIDADANLDADPVYKNDADSCRSGSITLFGGVLN